VERAADGEDGADRLPDRLDAAVGQPDPQQPGQVVVEALGLRDAEAARTRV
jgi:hypothetical protein